MPTPSYLYYRIQDHENSHTVQKYVRLSMNDRAWQMIQEHSDDPVPLEILELELDLPSMRPLLREHHPVWPASLTQVRNREQLIKLVVLWGYAIKTHLDPEHYRKPAAMINQDREVSAALIREGADLLSKSKAVCADSSASELLRARAHIDSLRALSLYAEGNVIAWPYTEGHKLEERTRILREYLDLIQEAEQLMSKQFPGWDSVESPAREMERSR